jgi:hypothetical protein
MKIVVPLLALLALLTGCSSLDTHANAKLADYHHLYVEHRLTDNHRIDELIVAELRAHGFDASSGPLTMLPEGVDAIATYQDRWQWDFKSYLIELKIEVRANFTGKPLAEGHYHQASAYTKSPAEVVHTILADIFKRK